MCSVNYKSLRKIFDDKRRGAHKSGLRYPILGGQNFSKVDTSQQKNT